ncbi:hypothetical protein BX265_8259 [Streptomyces sp. TLI_235]|nr:hypothetical protein BX265_8259 [Streptomyces sp. TLI_235]
MNQNAPGHDTSSGVTEAAARRFRAAPIPEAGSTGTAVDDLSTAERWVRVTAYALALALAALVLGTAGGVLLQAAATVIGAVHLPEHVPGVGNGLAATITRPVHTYLPCVRAVIDRGVLRHRYCLRGKRLRCGALAREPPPGRGPRPATESPTPARPTRSHRPGCP